MSKREDLLALFIMHSYKRRRGGVVNRKLKRITTCGRGGGGVAALGLHAPWKADSDDDDDGGGDAKCRIIA